jgi:putative MATE family efflux protein
MIRVVSPNSESSMGALVKRAFLLSLPVMVEHALHMLVGLTDTYMANHLRQPRDVVLAATAAVGTIAYFMWFVNLLTSAVCSGTTALVARATGARHRSLANAVCGQSILLALVLGIILSIALYIFAKPLILLTGLRGLSGEYAVEYLRLLCISVPFTIVMAAANASLRGVGDTLTPAISMIIVDIINMVLTWSMTFGKLGFKPMNFQGIAYSTIIAYVFGGVLQILVLYRGVGRIKLHLHRLKIQMHAVVRILRIGVPSGVEGILTWGAQFGVMAMINGLDENIAAAAHNNAIRIEGLSYMVSFGIGISAATLVGQALGAQNPSLAKRSAWACYILGGSLMTFCSFLFIFFGRAMSGVMSTDPVVTDLTARCLFITAFCQPLFAAAIIFSGSLRGAGDTFWVMILLLANILVVRLGGVLFAVKVMHWYLPGIWVILVIELTTRGFSCLPGFSRGGGFASRSEPCRKTPNNSRGSFGIKRNRSSLTGSVFRRLGNPIERITFGAGSSRGVMAK